MSALRRFPPLGAREPLRVLFCITSMPVGGAEVLLLNLIRRMNRERFAPELCCLKEAGPLGETLAQEIPVHANLLRNKYDVRILPRLVALLRSRRIDAVITVGAGDKMFWGRLAARCGGLPVIASALHSTGWPDGVGRANRWLTPITDAFIAVAHEHGRFLAEFEKFPASKVRVIPNGVDVERFRPRFEQRRDMRRRLGLDPFAPTVGIIAALRPEKNHALFLRAAAITHRVLPDAQFVVVGDGPERAKVEHGVQAAGLKKNVYLLGTRSDIPEVLGALDLFSLTSHNEANPVSILEALASGIPVVAPRVGSIPETVQPGLNGFLVEAGDAETHARYWTELLQDPELAGRMGAEGRERVVEQWSLERMVAGYEQLITEIYQRKCGGSFPHSAEARCEPETALSLH